MASKQGGYHTRYQSQDSHINHDTQAAQLFNAPADGRMNGRYNSNVSDDSTSEQAYGIRNDNEQGKGEVLAAPHSMNSHSSGNGNTANNQEWQSYPRNHHLDAVNNMASATPSSILDGNRTPMASYAAGVSPLSNSYGNNQSDMDHSRVPLPAPHQPYANANNNSSHGSIRAPEAYPVYNNNYPDNNEPYQHNNNSNNNTYAASSTHQQYYGTSNAYGMDQDERYANPKLDYSSQHNAYGGPANYQHQHLHQQYQHDNYEMHSVPHNNHNNNNYYNGSSNAPYANNPSEPTDKPAADVWDFPDGSRPSRTNAHGNQPIATAHGYSASGSTSRPPVVAPAPVGPILDPTGPAYGKFKLERRCCGCRQRYCIIVTFFVLIAIALILFFAWPRIPTASVSSVNTTKGMVINMPGKTPIDKTTGMEGSWSVVLSVENPNFIPWPFKTVTVDVTDPHLISNGKIGTGSLNNLRLSRGFTGIKVPVEIKYNASNATDPALVGMSNACDNGQLLSLNFNIFFQIAGLTFFKGTSTAAANYNCQTP